MPYEAVHLKRILNFRSEPSTPNRSRTTSIVVHEPNQNVQVTSESADAGPSEGAAATRLRRSDFSGEQSTPTVSTPDKERTQKMGNQVSDSRTSSPTRIPAPKVPKETSSQTSPRKSMSPTAETDRAILVSDQLDPVERSPKNSSPRKARSDVPSSPAKTAPTADASALPATSSRRSPRKEAAACQASPAKERSTSISPTKTPAKTADASAQPPTFSRRSPRKEAASQASPAGRRRSKSNSEMSSPKAGPSKGSSSSKMSSPKAGPSKGLAAQASPTRRGANKVGTLVEPENQLLVAGKTLQTGSQ